ncbi:MAG: ribosomal RNA small subunit methyltransferase A, partial [Chloroflexi bacterium]|nr:ribosomal RNA small subunit methyltransferase A [Chloroflexota bacterium]
MLSADTTPTTEQNTRRIRAMLRRIGTRAKKSLGQNFLVDQAVLDIIFQAAQIGREDNVIEVGPGPGILTSGLAERAGRVVAVEKDDALANSLRGSMAHRKNVSVLTGDILQVAPWEHVGDGYKVVANLPYNIASPTLRRFLSSPRPPKLMVVMVQKEVAEEIIAPPGRMRLLSVMVQYYAEAEIVATVQPHSFYPPPKVISAVLRLVPRGGATGEDPKAFFDFVAAGFRQPRKQLSNSLGQGLN